MSKVVFVGNVPYNMQEEELIETFKTVGHVVGFRLVYDRDTGKPKGYGFCEFADHETAMSAVRNLNNTDCGGRNLRIDLADSDPYLEGKTTVHGEIIDAGETRAQWRQREKRDHDDRRPSVQDPGQFLKSLPQGVPLAPGTTALDAISHRLATIDPAQLTEVLAQMKAFVINHPDQARMLLVAHPQLSYGLFQALLMNRIVDPAILQRMLAATQAGSSTTPAPAARPPVPAAPPSQMPPVQAPPMPSQYPPFPPTMPPTMQPAPYYQQPTPPQPPVPPTQSVPTPTPAPSVPTPAPSGAAPPQFNLPDNIDPAQRAMLTSVLALPPEQIQNLPPNEREAIMLLRAQFLGPNANKQS
ncbi:uncharacterized protein FOMMEDRAFT_142096 [Fomitiporia mediterranea MF3/22]|uniref:uncharacterized protein n=1 Tax=Fomitiporia mediterranea (strain MF3/22) TaxID=694068 RepID=UPI0004407593|nr:uncharacterized protein FOMMEDRAFT_142096 [Fomitiporia mediterranea MF3/22]EJD01485.1 hypothetical protein FOMMEDRAFT_142096 [Fomitiporia mediterranea MF3/22]